ncbi:MAG: hypothetical protein WAW59_01145 [Patescibacteria group bacterium]
MEVVDRSNTVVSIAHPNYTFRTVDEFRQQVGYITALGVNAIELNSTATRDWHDSIRDFRDYQMDSQATRSMLTFGSDCHNLYPSKVDTRHSLLGDMNPYISDVDKILAARRIRDFTLRQSSYVF